ncbi:MAG: GMC family oxidoreductase [Comamonadaceae bacterium]|nr:GMC family oxidoreductase [Comamonadaceae bacterium]
MSTTTPSAETLSADVIVIGAGAVGSMLAWQLARQGAKVLMVEAGPRIDRATAVQHFQDSAVKGPNAPYPSQDYAPHPMHASDYMVQAGPDVFGGSFMRAVGGTTWHWTGFSTRFRPNDFKTRTLYGVGEDWPLAYDDLLAHYLFTEREWGTAGDDAYDQGGPRHGVPFPLPPVPLAYSDQVIRDALAPLGYTMGPFSHARNSEPFDGRPPCCGSASCVPICPIGAKYDASVHVAKAEAAGVRLLPQTLVEHIEVGPGQLIQGLRLRRADGSRAQARARLYLLAAHAIETPNLLLRSAQPHAPQGVANRSDAVGRYLMGQVDLDTRALTREPLYTYRAPTTTAGILELRDGPFRKQHAAIGTSFLNRGWRTGLGPMQRTAHLIKTGLRGAALTTALNDQCARELAINSSVETLPVAHNRVVPDPQLRDSSGMPRPRVSFTIDGYSLRAIDKARQRHAEITRALGCTDITSDAPSIATAIIAGTARMGTDARRSVVDPWCRSHDHANLFIVGTANFPTMPINAPTLTAVALGLRALPLLAQDLAAGRFAPAA